MYKSEKPVVDADTIAAKICFEPIETIAGRVGADVLVLCDHASNAMPDAYQGLGLSDEDLARHIAWDIGAADVARRIAEQLSAPAILTRFSRLLIDANRGPDDPTLVMRLSDGRIIPGNARIDAPEIDRRRRLYWEPYRRAIGEKLDAMMAQGDNPAVLSIHSFTPVWKGVKRCWHAGILWDSDPRLARPLIDELRAAGFAVGDNEPYDGALKGDTLDAEVTRRGLAGCLVEIRQDLIAARAQAHAWADRLVDILRPILARPELHRQEFRPSRTGRHAANASS